MTQTRKYLTGNFENLNDEVSISVILNKRKRLGFHNARIIVHLGLRFDF